MIVKSIDQHGRVIVPIDLLRSIGVDRGDSVEIYGYQTGQGEPAIIIKKFQETCHFCPSPLIRGKFHKVNGKKICKECLRQIRKELSQIET